MKLLCRWCSVVLSLLNKEIARALLAAAALFEHCVCVEHCVTPLQLLQKRAQGLLSCAMEGLGSATAENVSVTEFLLVCSRHLY